MEMADRLEIVHQEIAPRAVTDPLVEIDPQPVNVLRVVKDLQLVNDPLVAIDLQLVSVLLFVTVHQFGIVLLRGKWT